VPPSKKKKSIQTTRPASAGRGAQGTSPSKSPPVKSPPPKSSASKNTKKLLALAKGVRAPAANEKKGKREPVATKKGKAKTKTSKIAPASSKSSDKSAKKLSKVAPPNKPQPKLAKVPSAKPSVAKIAPPAKGKGDKGKPETGNHKKTHAPGAEHKGVASKHLARGDSKLSPPKAGATSVPASKKPADVPPPRPMAARKPAPPPPPKKSGTSPDIVAKIRSVQAEKELRKDLAQTPPKKTLTPITAVPPAIKGQDRIVLMVRDPYWLHAHWDVTRQTVDRAKAALVEQWHSVKPILRLLKLDDSGTTESAENIYRDIEIHGGVRNWYIDVDQPPSRFQIVMGYMTSNGRFYELVRSNTVTTPVPGGKEASDDHWADIAKDAERIYAMSGGYGDETQRGELSEVFEERLNRTMDLDVLSQFGSGAEGGLKRSRQFHFDVDAELIVFGSTHPDAHVSVGTEPVKVRSDGTFSIRLPFPDRRQVLPATARSRDGVDEQTVVIAVERNTKVMEPLSLEGDEQ
jgi:hypothetical protein